MRIKAKLKNNVIKVKAMAKHPMMTYNQAEKKLGDREKANFITHISGTINGETVIDMSTSQFLSKNPIFKFKVKGEGFAKKDKLIMTWTDRSGKSKVSKSKIK